MDLSSTLETLSITLAVSMTAFRVALVRILEPRILHLTPATPRLEETQGVDLGLPPAIILAEEPVVVVKQLAVEPRVEPQVGPQAEPLAEPVLVALAVRQPVVPGAEVQTARANPVILLASSAQKPTGVFAAHSETTSLDLSQMVDGN